MTNREAANQIASKITGETVNAGTTKEALDVITGKKSGTIAEALDTISQGEISFTPADETNDDVEPTEPTTEPTEPSEPSEPTEPSDDDTEPSDPSVEGE